MEPYTEVLLSWNVVEKRIRKLIEEDRYLSPEGKEAYAVYKEDEARKAIQKAQEKLERYTKVCCKEAIEKAIAEKFDGYRLPKESNCLFTIMNFLKLIIDSERAMCKPASPSKPVVYLILCDKILFLNFHIISSRKGLLFQKQIIKFCSKLLL